MLTLILYLFKTSELFLSSQKNYSGRQVEDVLSATSRASKRSLKHAMFSSITLSNYVSYDYF